jgi:two-component system response regulator MtrA
MDRILLVEDDEALGRQVAAHLERNGFGVTWLRSGDDALAEDPSKYALIVLDLMLPGAYGLDVLKAARSSAEVPVLILSARNETSDKVRALELGADDYVTKPFWPDELVARIRARLRRPALQREGRVVVGDLEIDLAARTVVLADEDIPLAPVEFDLLAELARHRGQAVSRLTLVDALIDPDTANPERALDVHVSRLRKKLGPAGARVRTVYKIGYRLEDRPSA